MIFTIHLSDLQNKTFFSRLSNPSILMQKISLFAQSEIQKNIERGVTPPNASLTKAVKKGDKVLRDNGNLINSINSRYSATEASVHSNHIAAVMNNPNNNDTEYTIKPKKAKYLTIPAGAKTRTLQRKYGFSPSEVLDGLKKDGYNVFRPYKKGTKQRANVIIASLKEVKKLKNGAKSSAEKYQPFAVFILKKSVTVPIRRFMFLTEEALQQVDSMTEHFYDGT